MTHYSFDGPVATAIFCGSFILAAIGVYLSPTIRKAGGWAGVTALLCIWAFMAILFRVGIALK